MATLAGKPLSIKLIASDGVVRLLNAISLEEPSGGAQLKGCNMLAPDRAHGSSHFLITQKKKLILATAKQGLKTVKVCCFFFLSFWILTSEGVCDS